MKLIAYTDNIFFLAKLEGSLKQAGIDAVCSSTQEQVSQIIDGEIWGGLVDLHANKAFEIIQSLVAGGKPVAAYCGHAEVDLRQKAKSAGVSILLSNSDLVDNLTKALEALHTKACATPGFSSGDTA